MATSRRAALYVRVSTTDEGQTVENQLQPLHEAARRLGWTVVAVFRDEGISGAKGRQQATTFLRCQTNALHLERRRPRPAWMRCSGREFNSVEAWSACRLGRSLPDLIALLGELQAPETYEFWGQPESPVGLSRLSATV